MSNIDLYNKEIAHVNRFSYPNSIPEISVIVIAHKFKDKLDDNINMLQHQKHVNHEVVFVNNGCKDLVLDNMIGQADIQIDLKRNTGAYMARNIGARFASGDILVFVDDDGIPADENYLANFKKYFDEYECVTVRGACRGDNGNDPAFYDCGPEPYPAYPTLEGNCAISRPDFLNIGGWNDEIMFGSGGFELSCRLLEAGYNYYEMIYAPEPILLHNYIDDPVQLKEKQQRQEQGRKITREQHPQWNTYLNQWVRLTHRKDALVKKGQKPVEPETPKTYSDNIKNVFKGYVYRFDGKKYRIKAPDREIVKKMIKAGYISYYRQEKIPRIVEFRKGEESHIVVFDIGR